MNIIECHGLTKSYGRTRALSNLNLTLQTGEPIALIGPNGAGKTTLLSLLCGFIQPSSGSATILDQKPGSVSLVGRLSALPQDAQFDPQFSIANQLLFFARLQSMSGKQAKADVERVLDQVKLTEIAGKKANSLSHGMRKRVALAQALLGKPEVILLDEPTAGIDPPNVKIIRDLIRSMAGEATFIISSHNLDELEKLCGSVVYLNQGELVQSGSLDEPDNSGFLTIRIPGLTAQEFIPACTAIDGVINVQQQAQGDFLIECSPDTATDQALLAMLASQGWNYRHLINGRSLEERLYGRPGSE